MQVSILMVRALASEVERAGASRDRFLREARIDVRWIEEGAVRLPAADYVRAVEAALTVSGDPALGLHMGEHVRAVMFDVVGPLAEQAPTLRTSIEAGARYARLLADGHDFLLHEEGELAAIRFPSLRGELPVVRLTAEFSMVALLSNVRAFIGEAARPQRVCFGYAAPPYAQEYQRVFGGLASFGHKLTEMAFPRTWLDKAQPFSSPELYMLLKDQADRTLARLERDATLSARIARIFESHGPRLLTMDDVARELETSARSLRRRMLQEGLSFSELLTLHRTRVAKAMLERPSASIQDTAYQMGFASPAAFHRAFKRWTGMTPKQYRDSF